MILSMCMMVIWKHVLVVVVHVVVHDHDHDPVPYLVQQAFPPCRVSLAKVILAHHHPLLVVVVVVKAKYSPPHQDHLLFHRLRHHQEVVMADVVAWVPEISWALPHDVHVLALAA